MATDNDSLEGDHIHIVYPPYDDYANANANENENEIIDALKQETRQVHLVLNFDDDTFNQSEKIRDAILFASKKTVGLRTKVSCYNDCTNQNLEEQQLHTRCLEFFCQLLAGGRNNHNHGAGAGAVAVAGVEEFDYFNLNADRHPLTLIDANKVSAAIASNGNIKKLDFGDSFHERGAFECIFNAVLDGGITDFDVYFLSSTLTELRAIDITNLATNTTLKTQLIHGSSSFTTAFTEQFATQLVNILKTNQSLENQFISSNMLNNAGREKLLNGLKEENNSTLLNLDVNYGGLNSSRSDDPIQSKINTEMKWNRIWKRYNTNYGLPAIILAEKEKKTFTASIENEPLRKKRKMEQKEHGKKNITLDIYPVLLEILQNRLTHLYQFLQNENQRLTLQVLR